MMNMPEEGDLPEQMPEGLLPEDKWILSGFNNVVREATENMDKFELGIAVQKVHDFIWDEFCDWYIEMVKPRLYETEDAASHTAALWTLQTVLQGSLKLLHPYMPFVTEEIFCTIQDKEPSIMISDWPVWKEEFNFPEEEQAIETIKEAVRAIRTARNERGVAPSRKAKVIIVSEDEKIRRIFEEDRLFFERLASASELVLQAGKEGIGEGTVSIVLPFATAFIPLADLLDIQAEIARLNKEKKRLEGELKRSAGMLRNEKFLSKAPAEKIAAEKEKQQKYEQQMAGVIRELEELSSL
jgi:valyl-tRNA synthetase